jgi:hypothetical protein
MNVWFDDGGNCPFTVLEITIVPAKMSKDAIAARRLP